MATPETNDQLRDAVLASESILAVGNRTKSPLSQTDACLLSMRAMSGIEQYEPSEFTFTALAGTPLREITATLAERGQYLPFEPVLIESGATIGGAVAAGLSGSGRFRYGGIRDFLLGVRLLSGEGEWIQAGGKVVKNAAGFDIPKFLVGSLGRFGVMVELTFKVFPRPIALRSLSVSCESHHQARQRMSRAANSRWELDAVDYRPSQQAVHLRLGGPASANEAIANEIRSEWGDDVHDLDGADEWWRDVGELRFGAGETLVKVPTTGQTMLQLCESLGSDQGAALHVSLAGDLVWIAVDGTNRLQSLDTLLRSLALTGLVVRGEGPALVGAWNDTQMHHSLKQAMDPSSRFPEFPALRKTMSGEPA